MSEFPYLPQITDQQRELIREAMAAANPDIEGDLMRELDKRGVGHIIRQSEENFKQYKNQH